MSPELRERLTELAQWHAGMAARFTDPDDARHLQHHDRAAADIRAAIVSADDATKNLLVRQHIKADRRKYDETPGKPSAFGSL